MTKQNLSQWFTAATNVAVFFGVILLIVELRQNIEIARVDLLEARRTSLEQSEVAFLDPALNQTWVKALTDPASMTLAEMRAMDAYLAVNLYQALRLLDLENAGLISREELIEYMELDFPFVFGNRYAKVWWEFEGETWTPELVEIARPIVKSIDDDLLVERYDQIQRRFRGD